MWPTWEESDLVLDWRIKIWVLVPITVATFVMGLLRHYVVLLLLQEPRVDIFKFRDASALARAHALREASGFIHPAQFEARRAYFLTPDGPLRKQGVTPSPMSLMMNPENLGNQVIGLLSSIVPQMVLGAWARFLFSGFAVCRVPFPLGQRFRGMLQAGIERAGQDLDVSYVSALSWYIINLFGNSSIVQLFLSADNEKESAITDAHAADMAGQVASVFQGFNDAREVERNNLQAFEYRNLLSDVESKVLKWDPASVA